MDQVDKSEDGGHEAADEFDEAGADEIADAFDVAHDAGNERAGFVSVVKGDGEAADVGLHLAAELGDHFLCGLGEELGESEGSEALDDGGSEDAEDDRGQQIDLVLDGHVVYEIFCGSGKDEAADAVDGH